MDAIDAERARVLSHVAESYQVPQSPLKRERIGVDGPAAFLLASRCTIRDLYALACHDALPQGMEYGFPGLIVARLEPVDDEALAGQVYLMPKIIGENVVQLGSDRRDCIVVGLSPYLSHQVRPHIEHGGFFCGKDQRGQFVASHERKAAVWPSLRVDGNAHLFKHRHVAVYGSVRDFEFLGEVSCLPDSP